MLRQDGDEKKNDSDFKKNSSRARVYIDLGSQGQTEGVK